MRDEYLRTHCPADDLKPDGDAARFRRWEWFWEQRVLPSGEFPDAGHLAREHEAFMSRAGEQFAGGRRQLTAYPATWTSVGPAAPQPQGTYLQNVGRVNIVVVHPDDQFPTRLWAGTSAGGLWKSANGGTSWSWVPIESDLLTEGITDITFDPFDPDIMYATTGECDGPGDSFPTTWSQGVLKSTDGGLTWSNIGLGGNDTKLCRVRALATTPYRTLLVARIHSGLPEQSHMWRRVEDGVSQWTRATFPPCCPAPDCFDCRHEFIDLDVHPTDPQVAYASTYKRNTLGPILPGAVFRTTDAGATWNEILPGSSGDPDLQPVDAVRIDTTEAEPDLVVALSASHVNLPSPFFVSEDGGDTWERRATVPDGFDSQGHHYNLEVAVDDHDPDGPEAPVILIGGITNWRSLDGGFTWTGLPCPVESRPHVDTHGLTFFRGSLDASVVYNANDGGIAMLTGLELSQAICSDLSTGLDITQFFKLGTSPHDSGLVLGGSQDNGSMRFSQGAGWTTPVGGDGGDCLVSWYDDPGPTDPAPDPFTYFSTALLSGGSIYRCNAVGQSCVAMTHAPGFTGQQVPLYVQHPTEPGTLWLGGYYSIEKTTDSGATWVNLPTGMEKPTAIAVSASNPDVLYMVDHRHGTSAHHHKSVNGGVTWLFPGDPEFPLYSEGGYVPTSIVVHPKSDQIAWIAFSGYPAVDADPEDKARVMKTTDGGETWTDVSANLPLYPVNSMVYLPGSPNGLFAGTDLSVFYRDDTMTVWQEYDDAPPAIGLPKVPIMDLEIQKTHGLLRAATWGRGMWETSLCGGERLKKVHARAGDDQIHSLLAVPICTTCCGSPCGCCPPLDASYVFTGYVTSGGERTLSLSQTNSSYDVMWGPLPGAPYRAGSSQGNSVFNGQGGGYIVVGQGSVLPAKPDIYLLKTNASGVKEWDRSLLPWPEDDEGADVRPMAGGYLIAGSTFERFQPNTWDALVVKVDSSGLNPSFYPIFGAGDSRAVAMAQTSDGGFVIAAHRDLTPTHDRDIFLLKTDANGNPSAIPGNPFQVARTGIDQPRSVIAVADGYVVAGFTQATLTAPANVYVVKLSTSGVVLWEYVSPLPADDRAYSVQAVGDDYMVVGTARDDSYGAPGTGDLDLYAIRLNGADGAELWRRGFGGVGTEEGRALRVVGPLALPITAAGSAAAPGGDADHMLLRLDDCPTAQPPP